MINLISGTEMKRIRIGRLWTEEQVFDLTGIEVSRLLNLESDQDVPNLEEIYKLSKIYKISMDSFIKEMDKSKSNVTLIGTLFFENHEKLLAAEDFFKSEGYFVEFQVIYATKEFTLRVFEISEGEIINAIR